MSLQDMIDVSVYWDWKNKSMLNSREFENFRARVWRDEDDVSKIRNSEKK